MLGTASRPFILFAHPRSGSTSLRDCIDAHHAISVLNEPFNPTRGPGGWGHDYLSDLERGDSLKSIFESITSEYHGFKHLLGQLSFEQDIDLFRWSKPRILLRRRNQLQAIVSNLIAVQTKQWHRRGKPVVDNVELQPLRIQQIKGYLNTQRGKLEELETVIKAESLSVIRVDYEDIFDASVPLERRVAIVAELMWSAFQVQLGPAVQHNIAGKLHHGANKINSVATYSRVPNIDEIRELFANDVNGFI